jgi:tetratricopeptide (TPR) repeat protein
LKILGKDHPDVATSYNNIGAVYKDQGKKDKALKYCNKALDIELKILGKDHLDVAISYSNIGLIYEKQGKYKEAFEYYNKAFKICKKRLGTSHYYTTDTLQSMIRIKKYLARTKSL